MQIPNDGIPAHEFLSHLLFDDGLTTHYLCLHGKLIVGFILYAVFGTHWVLLLNLVPTIYP
jgi:hypothetical protein